MAPSSVLLLAPASSPSLPRHRAGRCRHPFLLPLPSAPYSSLLGQQPRPWRPEPMCSAPFSTPWTASSTQQPLLPVSYTCAGAETPWPPSSIPPCWRLPPMDSVPPLRSRSKLPAPSSSMAASSPDHHFPSRPPLCSPHGSRHGDWLLSAWKPRSHEWHPLPFLHCAGAPWAGLGEVHVHGATQQLPRFMAPVKLEQPSSHGRHPLQLPLAGAQKMQQQQPPLFPHKTAAPDPLRIACFVRSAQSRPTSSCWCLGQLHAASSLCAVRPSMRLTSPDLRSPNIDAVHPR